MTQYWYHVVPRMNKKGFVNSWAVYAEGLDNARRVMDSKGNAVEWAKQKSRNDPKNPGVVIHGTKGYIKDVYINPVYDKRKSAARNATKHEHPPSPKWKRWRDKL